MSKPTQILEIDPSTELTFRGPFTDVITTELTLRNPSDRNVCFKVKTTAPKQYCVRPNSGFVAPKDRVKVLVMLQPLDLAGEEKSKHKFMVQSAFVPDGEGSIDAVWKSLSESKAELMDSKLKVVFHNPDKSEAEDKPINESMSHVDVGYSAASGGVETISSHSVGGGSEATAAELRRVVDEKKRMEASLTEMEKSNAKLQARLSQLESSKTSISHSPSSSETGLQLLHLIVAVVLALIGGLVLGKLF